MAKLELVILSASLFIAVSGISLPALKFFGSESDAGKLQSNVDDAGKSEKHEQDYENAFTTLNLPGLPGIPLPPMPPVPAFLQRPVVKATKTVVVEVTHYEKTHPVCWTVNPHKLPCDHHEEVHIKPTSAVYSVKPTYHISDPFTAIHDKIKKKPSKPSTEHKPVHEPEVEASEPEVEVSKPVAEAHKDATPAESREGRYIQFGTPVITAGEDFKINEAPQESAADMEDGKDSRILPRLRVSTIYETKTIYATKTQKVQDHMTATLIIDNCVPVDESIPPCKPHELHESLPLTLADTYGQSYEHHFEELEDSQRDEKDKEKGHLNFIKRLIAQQAALAEGGAHYAAQVAAQHAAYHAALAHKFHSTAAHIAQNNANNALAAEHAALDQASHHQEAEHAAQESLAHLLSKYTKGGQQEEEHSTEPEKEKEKEKEHAHAAPSQEHDHWRIVAEEE